MEKSVILNLLGNLNQGFTVLFQIKEGDQDIVQINGRLPANSKIIQDFSKWQQAFKNRLQRAATRSSIKVKTTQYSCKAAADDLRDHFNTWLNSSDADWQKI